MARHRRVSRSTKLGRPSCLKSRRILAQKIEARSAGFTLVELLIVIAIIGLLAAIAIPNLLNAVQRGKQKRTMADMRSLASAIEAYAVDNNAYPPASCASGLYVVLGTLLRRSSFSNLSPTYIAEPPWRDGWGYPFIYANDTNNYCIWSLGRDRAPDKPPPYGTTTDLNDDIIYSDGTFLQWPEGTQH